MRALILLAALTGCATHSPEESFAQELSGRTAGEAQRCVPITGSRSLRIIDRQTLAYEGGRTLWVNRLSADCRGLRQGDTLIAEVHGSQYCRGDRVRGLTPGSTIPGPSCLLADFIPYRR